MPRRNEEYCRGPVALPTDSPLRFDTTTGERGLNRIETLANGDVQLVTRLDNGHLQARRFRMHFGHVVEVQADDKVRRVGPELTFRGPSLVVRHSLLETIADAAGAAALPLNAAPAAERAAPLPRELAAVH
jgi:hypothetical protein